MACGRLFRSHCFRNFSAGICRSPECIDVRTCQGSCSISNCGLVWAGIFNLTGGIRVDHGRTDRGPAILFCRGPCSFLEAFVFAYWLLLRLSVQRRGMPEWKPGKRRTPRYHHGVGLTKCFKAKDAATVIRTGLLFLFALGPPVMWEVV